MVLWCSQQINWVLVYFQALASDSGPRLSGKGGEGRGGAAHGELTLGLFLTLESLASQSQKDWGVGHARPLLFCPESKGLSRLKRSWHFGVEGRCGKGRQGTTQSTREGGILPGLRVAGPAGAFCYLAEQDLLTSGMPSGARE